MADAKISFVHKRKPAVFFRSAGKGKVLLLQIPVPVSAEADPVISELIASGKG